MLEKSGSSSPPKNGEELSGNSTEQNEPLAVPSAAQRNTRMASEFKRNLKRLLSDKIKINPETLNKVERLGSVLSTASPETAESLVADMIKIARSLAREEQQAECLVRAIEQQIFHDSHSPAAVKELVHLASSFSGDPELLLELLENCRQDVIACLQDIKFEYLAEEAGELVEPALAWIPDQAKEEAVQCEASDIREIKELLSESKSLGASERLEALLQDEAGELELHELRREASETRNISSSAGQAMREQAEQILEDFEVVRDILQISLVSRSPEEPTACSEAAEQIRISELPLALQAALKNSADPLSEDFDELPISLVTKAALAECIGQSPFDTEAVMLSLLRDLEAYSEFYAQDQGLSDFAARYGSPELISAELKVVHQALRESKSLFDCCCVAEEIEKLCTLREEANSNLLGFYWNELREAVNSLRPLVQSNEGEVLQGVLGEEVHLERLGIKDSYLPKTDLEPVLSYLNAERRAGAQACKSCEDSEVRALCRQYSIPDFVELVEGIVVASRKIRALQSLAESGRTIVLFDPNEHYRPAEELFEGSATGEESILQKIRALEAVEELLPEDDARVIIKACNTASWKLQRVGLYAESEQLTLEAAAALASSDRFLSPEEFGETIKGAQRTVASVLFPQQEAGRLIEQSPYPRELLPTLRALNVFGKELESSEELFRRKLPEFMECFERYRDGKESLEKPLYLAMTPMDADGTEVPRLVSFDQIPGMLVPVNLSVRQSGRLTLFSYNPLRISSFQEEMNNGAWQRASDIGPRFFRDLRRLVDTEEFQAALDGDSKLFPAPRLGVERLERKQFGQFLLEADRERLQSVYVSRGFLKLIDRLLRSFLSLVA